MAGELDRTGGIDVPLAYVKLRTKDQKVVDRAIRSRSCFPQSPAERERLEKANRGEPVIVDRVTFNGSDILTLPKEFRNDLTIQRFRPFADDTLVPISTLMPTEQTGPPADPG